jgi:hypothetical protein
MLLVLGINQEHNDMNRSDSDPMPLNAAVKNLRVQDSKFPARSTSVSSENVSQVLSLNSDGK